MLGAMSIRAEENRVSNPLIDSIVEMQEDKAIALTLERLGSESNPLQILDDCRVAVEIVGKRFETGDYFLPELVMAGEMLKKIATLVKPHLTQETVVQKRGKVLIGTVKGDIHDLGKDMVVFLLNANGFEVVDLGVDVPPAKFVDRIRECQPDVVGLSGLLTVAAESMKKTVEAIRTAGLRRPVKIMIGGGMVDDHVRALTGADAFGSDAMAAVSLAKRWTGS